MNNQTQNQMNSQTHKYRFKESLDHFVDTKVAIDKVTFADLQGRHGRLILNNEVGTPSEENQPCRNYAYEDMSQTAQTEWRKRANDKPRLTIRRNAAGKIIKTHVKFVH